MLSPSFPVKSREQDEEHCEDPAYDINKREIRSGILLLKLSASDSEHLLDKSQSCIEQLCKNPDDAKNICSEFSTDNITGELVWAVVECSAPALIEQLRLGPPAPSRLEANRQAYLQGRKSLLMVFSGHGSMLDHGMWLKAYEMDANFAAALDKVCYRAWTAHGINLRESLNLDHHQSSSKVFHVQMALEQAVIFALEVALTEAWAARGVKPDAVIGHSFGEYAAAVAAGAISWEEGLAMVIARGKCVSELAENGGMVAVFLPQADLETIMNSFGVKLVVACCNAPNLTVLSGIISDIERMERVLADKGITFRRLSVKYAFHSPCMEPMLVKFDQSLKSILDQTPKSIISDSSSSSKPAIKGQEKNVRFFSTVYAKELFKSDLRERQYWIKHVEMKVDFYGAMSLIDTTFATVVEIGPTSNLIGLVKRCMLGTSAPLVVTDSLGSQGLGFNNATAQVLMSPWGLDHARTVSTSHQTKASHEEPSSESPESATLSEIDLATASQPYFEGIEKLLLPLFDNDVIDLQPRAILVVGCGTGALLKKLYDFVATFTNRGKHLHAYPLFLIGMDSNARGLHETKVNLSGYPHRCILGHISNPKSIMEEALNLELSVDDILHVQAFVDRKGQHESIQDLVEYLRKWGAVIGRHGIIILENQRFVPVDVDADKINVDCMADTGMVRTQALTLMRVLSLTPWHRFACAHTYAHTYMHKHAIVYQFVLHSTFGCTCD
jgi:malonyl CoA-acyl carrier protein transacylase